MRAEKMKRLKRELSIAQDDLAFLKKRRRILRIRKSEIRLNSKICGSKQIAHRCKLLGVSRSGYYEWRIKGTLSSAPRNAIKTEEVQKAFYDLKRRYGSLRITRLLREKGVIISRKTVAKIMRLKQIACEGGTQI